VVLLDFMAVREFQEIKVRKEIKDLLDFKG
jgi:hypothetical protein